MREKMDYRAWLEELHAVFGSEVAVIPVTKVSKYLGKNYRTLLADKTFPAKKIGGRIDVPIVGLARWLS